MTPSAIPPYAVLIPARYASKRLPGKVLLRETGKYLVQHVYERACEAPGVRRVVVLTDDDRVEKAVQSFQGAVRRTRPDHASGTDRCAEAAAELAEAVVVNVQGDEPLFAPEDLGALAGAVAAGGAEAADIATLGYPFPSAEAAVDPHAVKALRDAAGWAVGFTRRLPPASERLRRGDPTVLHHVGIYAFRRERLLAFPGLVRPDSERRERLEQLRALASGWRIRVLDASVPAFGVDTPEDYQAFRARFA